MPIETARELLSFFFFGGNFFITSQPTYTTNLKPFFHPTKIFLLHPTNIFLFHPTTSFSSIPQTSFSSIPHLSLPSHKHLSLPSHKHPSVPSHKHLSLPSHNCFLFHKNITPEETFPTFFQILIFTQINIFSVKNVITRIHLLINSLVAKNKRIDG